MTNPILRLDERLLATTARFAKWFNQLTGLDNFWLAKRLAYLFSAQTLWIGKSLIFSVVEDAEQRGIEEMQSGVRNAKHQTELLRCRWFALGYMLLIAFLCFFANTLEPGLVVVAWIVRGFALLGISLLPITYLISISHPPLKRSQTWQWLKGKLSALGLRLFPSPQPTPAPVSSHWG